jgi:hypothetical protein
MQTPNIKDVPIVTLEALAKSSQLIASNKDSYQSNKAMSSLL